MTPGNTVQGGRAMAATRSRAESPFAKCCGPSFDILWKFLGYLNELIVSEHSIVGWPELGSFYIEQHCPDVIGFLGQGKPEVSGPIRLKTRGRFFDVRDPIYKEYVCMWGLIKPMASNKSCLWATAKISPTGRDDQLLIVTQKHTSAKEASATAEVNPLEMMAKLHGLAGEVRDRCADDLRKAERLETTIETQLGLLADVIKRCFLGEHMEVGGAIARSCLLEQLDSSLLRQPPFDLDLSVTKKVAAAKAGL
ncbi:MAG: hypothetical protein CEN92_366 [Candidatus Berkelbacteria bacterium Licking1014_96]|uniref:Uncharacterized protein n=1 Tax=Candidatus Berkelbacteria bacterium Licking1014_96 TaxID=2017149 RepID=A0A554LD83_9BACT|nr:MAG: hypothetical protein CEN92_366 [Candidatus Berkelbacteria bacterium Licking1014_96]